ncbi:hypothetical protein [Acinetobacter baumannii]|uniref:hypothetical protein n=1 Tax=Acinetobacter baumannii TaxID=470 RepID=UPI002342592B|nr:hypothetical protein [Acinetobacter baumannii]MDC4147467.1 hypothetical protein [Acinetobacter baumannii]
MNKLTTLLLGLIVINFVGCASEYRLAKPHGKWVPINQQETKTVKSVSTKSTNSNTSQSK